MLKNSRVVYYIRPLGSIYKAKLIVLINLLYTMYSN